MFSRNQAQKRGVLRCAGETLEITCFHDQGHGCMGFDPLNADQPIDLLGVVIQSGERLSPFVQTFNLVAKLPQFALSS